MFRGKEMTELGENPKQKLGKSRKQFTQVGENRLKGNMFRLNSYSHFYRSVKFLLLINAPLKQ
jgi:hypothetical protein